MTEVPEHLLKRSRDRRAALGLGGGGDGGGSGGDAAPAAAEPSEASGAGLEPAAATAAAKPAAAAPAPAPEPVPPYVEAALTRKKIPIWAMPVLAFLPLWLVIYIATLSPAGTGKLGQLQLGQELYATRCASCHGADGAGGVGRVFKGGELVKTFPTIEGQLEFVWNGSNGMGPAGTPYGDANREGGQHKTLSYNGNAMPAFKGVLTQAELVAVVRYERETLSGEKLDPTLLAADLTRNHADGKPLLDATGLNLIGSDGKALFDAQGRLVGGATSEATGTGGASTPAAQG